jgi:hypothetical protein
VHLDAADGFAASLPAVFVIADVQGDRGSLAAFRHQGVAAARLQGAFAKGIRTEFELTTPTSPPFGPVGAAHGRLARIHEIQDVEPVSEEAGAQAGFYPGEESGGIRENAIDRKIDIHGKAGIEVFQHAKRRAPFEVEPFRQLGVGIQRQHAFRNDLLDVHQTRPEGSGPAILDRRARWISRCGRQKAVARREGLAQAFGGVGESGMVQEKTQGLVERVEEVQFPIVVHQRIRIQRFRRLDKQSGQAGDAAVVVGGHHGIYEAAFEIGDPGAFRKIPTGLRYGNHANLVETRTRDQDNLTLPEGNHVVRPPVGLEELAADLQVAQALGSFPLPRTHVQLPDIHPTRDLVAESVVIRRGQLAEMSVGRTVKRFPQQVPEVRKFLGF